MNLPRSLTASLALAVVAAFVITAACDDTPQCIPATTQTGCACNTGGPGFEVCSGNGLGWGDCICGVPDGGSSDASDGSAADSDATDIDAGTEPLDAGGDAVTDGADSPDE
jgi:hypothetical protein